MLYILALGFSASAVISHVVVHALTVLPSSSSWTLPDEYFANGRCDQYGEQADGSKYVPFARVSAISILKTLILSENLVRYCLWSPSVL
jgi:hypothetical protein